MKKYIVIFFLCFTALNASDHTDEGYNIWVDLGITKKSYYNRSADMGVLMGFLFASTIVYLVARR